MNFSGFWISYIGSSSLFFGEISLHYLQIQGCGSGLDPHSVTLWIRIRIGNPDPRARKIRNFSGKMHFSYFLKNYFLKKYLMNNTGIFNLI
jgi:hypothetical protein